MSEHLGEQRTPCLALLKSDCGCIRHMVGRIIFKGFSSNHDRLQYVCPKYPLLLQWSLFSPTLDPRVQLVYLHRHPKGHGEPQHICTSQITLREVNTCKGSQSYTASFSSRTTFRVLDSKTFGTLHFPNLTMKNKQNRKQKRVTGLELNRRFRPRLQDGKEVLTSALWIIQSSLRVSASAPLNHHSLFCTPSLSKTHQHDHAHNCYIDDTVCVLMRSYM